MLIGLVRVLAGILLAMPLLAATPARAAVWSIVPEDSRIQFEYERNGQPAIGRFTRFVGEGRFDTNAPGEATLELRIESASIDLSDKLASAFATSAEWFDSVQHPQMIYRLQHLTPEGGNQYRADGDLTIRGRTRTVTTSITLDIGPNQANATGSLNVNRTDYWLGVGPSALFVRIGPQVSVHFELTAHPQP